MQDANASSHNGGARQVKSKGGIPSPYIDWWNIEFLEKEAKRLSLLPRPKLNADIVMHWRRKQVWLIGLRIRELRRGRNVN